MLVGEFFDKSLSRTANGFHSFGASAEAAEEPPTEYTDGLILINLFASDLTSYPAGT